MAGWLSPPVQLHGMRMFECEDLSPADCDWYKQRWHFWYIADYVFALPTVAFFMCTIGVFIISNIVSTLLGYRKSSEPPIWRKFIAVMRYLTYRGFYVRALRWSSAPIGVLLLGLAGTIFFFCMDLAPKPYYWVDEMFGGSPPLATRSGWMALACMPFVFATATKANWITLVTGISHERLQVFHRWISYAFFILALLHTFPFIVYHVHWHDMEAHFTSSLIFYWTGIVALIFQAWLTFMSHSTIRKFGYEFFKATHLLAAVIFIVTFFWHCDYTLTSWDYFIATAALYIPCYTYPHLRTFFEHGGIKRASIALDASGFIRIAIPTTHLSTWKPGQHCFLRFTSFGIWHAVSSHPFTITSTPGGECELVFYVRPKGGFTRTLMKYAVERPGEGVKVLVDGPYGGINLVRFRDADHVLVIAGGSGAGWCLPFIERFVRRDMHARGNENEAGTKESLQVESCRPVALRVVLATRDIASRTWFLGAVDALLEKYSSTSGFRVQVYLTGTAASEAHDSSENASSVNDAIETKLANTQTSHIPGREYEGRPDLASIITEEANEGAQSLSVFVCGPTTMLNDTRNAVAAENLRLMKGKGGSGVYLHSEHFSWA